MIAFPERSKEEDIKLGYLWTVAAVKELREGELASEAWCHHWLCGAFDLQHLALQATGPWGMELSRARWRQTRKF